MDILKSIDVDTVEFSVDQKTNIMTIKTAKDTFEINGIPASEYVALPEVPQTDRNPETAGRTRDPGRGYRAHVRSCV